MIEKLLISVLSLGLIFATWTQNIAASQDAQAPDQSAAPAAQAPPYAQQTPGQLQQLVAPIALYPDSLVAQILAASTFPEQVVEADRWVQAHSDLKGDALAQAVDQQNWDPSVKALTAFPSVLGNMDKNLSWTSSLGDAYYNQQQDVMNAVQFMRGKAEQAGNLKTTPQQTVETQDSTIVIQPADPQVVYVPAYNPWLVYGYPVGPWPGWYPYPGIWYGGPYLSFGVGFGIGFYGGFGWGWGNWGFNWRGGYPLYNRGARRFTTEPISTAAVSAAGQVSALGTLAGAAEFTTVPAQQPAHSAEMLARPEDTLNLAVRPAPARERSAVTIMADRHGAIRRAEAAASVAAGMPAVAAGTAAAGITN
jgi:hypothetical protein